MDVKIPTIWLITRVYLNLQKGEMKNMMVRYVEETNHTYLKMDDDHMDVVKLGIQYRMCLQTIADNEQFKTVQPRGQG